MYQKEDKMWWVRPLLESLSNNIRKENERIAKVKQERAEARRKRLEDWEAKETQRKAEWEAGAEQRKMEAKLELEREMEQRKIKRMKEERRKSDERIEARRLFLAPWREAREKLRRGDIQEIGRRLGVKATTLSKAFGEGNTGSRNDYRILEEAKKLIEQRENI
jgi:exonuclease VII large subunit